MWLWTQNHQINNAFFLEWKDVMGRDVPVNKRGYLQRVRQCRVPPADASVQPTSRRLPMDAAAGKAEHMQIPREAVQALLDDGDGSQDKNFTLNIFAKECFGRLFLDGLGGPTDTASYGPGLDPATPDLPV